MAARPPRRPRPFADAAAPYVASPAREWTGGGQYRPCRPCRLAPRCRGRARPPVRRGRAGLPRMAGRAGVDRIDSASSWRGVPRGGPARVIRRIDSGWRRPRFARARNDGNEGTVIARRRSRRSGPESTAEACPLWIALPLPRSRSQGWAGITASRASRRFHSRKKTGRSPSPRFPAHRNRAPRSR